MRALLACVTPALAGLMSAAEACGQPPYRAGEVDRRARVIVFGFLADERDLSAAVADSLGPLLQRELGRDVRVVSQEETRGTLAALGHWPCEDADAATCRRELAKVIRADAVVDVWARRSGEDVTVGPRLWVASDFAVDVDTSALTAPTIREAAHRLARRLAGGRALRLAHWCLRAPKLCK